jgi:hypothetical protein
MYIISLPLKTPETLAFSGTIFRKPFGTEGVNGILYYKIRLPSSEHDVCKGNEMS